MLNSEVRTFLSLSLLLYLAARLKYSWSLSFLKKTLRNLVLKISVYKVQS